MEILKKILSRSNKQIVFYLTIGLLLYFVFLDEVSETFLINSSSKLLSRNSCRWLCEDTIVCCLLVLQVVFASLQAGFSDYYLRKKSLIVSISATLIALILLKIADKEVGLLLIAVIIKGVFGNTLPIAWAGIADEAQGKNVRFFLALSICALAIGSWGSLIVIPLVSISFLYKVIISILVIGVLVAIFLFLDPEDNPHKSSVIKSDQNVEKKRIIRKISLSGLFIKEFKGLYNLIKKPLNGLCLIIFLFTEIAFYQILFRIEVFDTYIYFFQMPIAIGIGYTLGTIFLGFIKSPDRIVSAGGLLIATASIATVNIFFYTDHFHQIIFIICFAFYSFGYALFTPALFTIITVREPLHDQGKCYGLLESTDSLASLLTFIFLFQTKTISHALALNISTLLILLSCILFFFVFRMVKKH